MKPSVRRVQSLTLATTLHDPDGSLLTELDEGLPKLKRVYRSISAATSPPTDPRVNRLLARHGVYAGTPKSNRRGPLYRLCLRHALTKGTERVHYLDLDRALHWLARGRAGSRSLAEVLARAEGYPVAILGRTVRAHAHHQESLFQTETILNQVMSKGLGLRGRGDFLAPSIVLDAKPARLLLRLSKASDSQIYGEWAALWFYLTPRVAYLESDWIDWETPDRERPLLRQIGLQAYRARFDTSSQWRLRLGLAAEILAGFQEAIESLPKKSKRATLRRL